MKKSTLTAVLAIVLVMSMLFTACVGNDNTTGTTDNAGTTNAPTTNAPETTAPEGTTAPTTGGDVEPPKNEVSWNPMNTAPEAETAYKLGMNQVTVGKTLYFTGEISGDHFLAMSEDVANAVDVYAEIVDGGYKLYFKNGDTKTYIGAETYKNANNKNSYGMTLVTDAANAAVFTYNAELGIHVTVINGTDCYMGSYNTFETISVSKTSFINAENAGVTQFQAQLYTDKEVKNDDNKNDDNKGDDNEGEDNKGDNTVPGTVEEILDKAFALAENATWDGEFELTGVITKIETIYGGSAYKITIKVTGDSKNREVLCFKVSGDYVRNLQVDDTMTVTSTQFQNYGGIIELNKCTLKSYELAEGHEPVVRVEHDAFTENGNKLTFNVAGFGKQEGWTKGKQYKTVTLKEGLTVVINCTAVGTYGENSGRFYLADNGNDTWRLYGSENATFTLTSDKEIASVKVTYEVNKDAAIERLTCNGAMYESGAAIEVNGTTVTFGVGKTDPESTISAHVRIVEIEITYAGGATETPSEGGNETTGTTEKLDIATIGANWEKAKAYNEITGEGCTITTGHKEGVSSVNTGKFYPAADENPASWRIYGSDGGYIVITAAEGKTIVSVKVSYTTNKEGSCLVNGDAQVESDAVVEVDGASITLTASGKVFITAIEIVYA